MRKKRSARKRNWSGNPALLAAAFTSVAATVVSVYLPMVQGFVGTAAVLGADLVPVADVYKRQHIRRATFWVCRSVRYI